MVRAIATPVERAAERVTDAIGRIAATAQRIAALPPGARLELIMKAAKGALDRPADRRSTQEHRAAVARSRRP
jgi:hypothetical protein